MSLKYQSYKEKDTFIKRSINAIEFWKKNGGDLHKKVKSGSWSDDLENCKKLTLDNYILGKIQQELEVIKSTYNFINAESMVIKTNDKAIDVCISGKLALEIFYNSN